MFSDFFTRHRKRPYLIGSSKLPGPKAKNGKNCFQGVWKEIICMKWVKW